MSLRIDQDHRRFREIVRGKIKQNLRKYITQGEMLGKKGKEVVSIPLPQIDIPHFRFGNKQTGGVGQGVVVGHVDDDLTGAAVGGHQTLGEAERDTGLAVPGRGTPDGDRHRRVTGDQIDSGGAGRLGRRRGLGWRVCSSWHGGCAPRRGR